MVHTNKKRDLIFRLYSKTTQVGRARYFGYSGVRRLCVLFRGWGDRKIPVIAMSANAFDDDVRNALNVGINSWKVMWPRTRTSWDSGKGVFWNAPCYMPYFKRV